MTAPAATNESYEIKRIEEIATACVAAFMHQLGSPSPPRSGASWIHDNYVHFITTSLWRKDSQILYFNHDHHDHRKNEYVETIDPFYVARVRLRRGHAVSWLQNVNLNVDGLTKIFDNSKGKDTLHIAYSEEVTLEESVSNSVRQAFTFDTTVSSETTVSGSYAGAELRTEAQLGGPYGFEKETARDTEESTSATSAVAIEFDCPPGSIKMVVVTKKHQRELIPVSGKFTVDFGMKMKLRHWWNHDAGGTQFRAYGQDYFEVSGVQGLYDLMRGLDTNYPRLSGFWQSGGACTREVRDGMLHILEPANRTYELSIDKMRVIENNESYVVSDLETVNHGDGEIIDMSEEENREAYQAA